MPDTQIINSALQTYGLSSLAGAGGGFSWWNILGGTVFSIIGWYAFRYGKREKSTRQMVLGIVLMVYPYFIGNIFVFFTIGIALTAALFFWRE